MTANSNDRSKFIKIDANAKTEEFKRSDHNDFATTSELKARKFSGVRMNELAQQNEFWMLGEVLGTVTFAEIRLDPAAMGKKHVEVFHMNPPEGWDARFKIITDLK